jgi:hypothetical protein
MTSSLPLKNDLRLSTWLLSLILFFSTLPALCSDNSQFQSIRTELVVRLDGLKRSVTVGLEKKAAQNNRPFCSYNSCDVVATLNHHVRTIKTALSENSKTVYSIQSIPIDFPHVFHSNSYSKLPING